MTDCSLFRIMNALVIWGVLLQIYCRCLLRTLEVGEKIHMCILHISNYSRWVKDIVSTQYYVQINLHYWLTDWWDFRKNYKKIELEKYEIFRWFSCFGVYIRLYCILGDNFSKIIQWRRYKDVMSCFYWKSSPLYFLEFHLVCEFSLFQWGNL